jgi:hypothetical protein
MIVVAITAAILALVAVSFIQRLRNHDRPTGLARASKFRFSVHLRTRTLSVQTIAAHFKRLTLAACLPCIH